jgi:purine-binding chemotaxis protein CheW
MVDQLLLFVVDGLSLGIPVERVEEVLRRHPVTRVPLAPLSVAGLLNLRGSIVSAIDLRDRLHRPPVDRDQQRMHVVVRAGGTLYSLLVDRIEDVHVILPNTRAAVPERLRPEVQVLSRGVVSFPDRVVLELDVDRLVEA